MGSLVKEWSIINVIRPYEQKEKISLNTTKVRVVGIYSY